MDGTHNSAKTVPTGETPPPVERGSFLLKLAGVVTVLSPLRHFFTLVTIYNAMQNNPIWNALKTPASPMYDPVYRTIAYTELALILAFGFFGIYNIFMYFARTKHFPTLFISLSFLSLLFSLGQSVLYSFVYSYAYRNTSIMAVDLLLRTVLVIVLVPYLLYSQKVKDTFVN